MPACTLLVELSPFLVCVSRSLESEVELVGLELGHLVKTVHITHGVLAPGSDDCLLSVFKTNQCPGLR